MADFTPHTIRY